MPGIEEADVVAVDEAQFLDDDLPPVVQFLADRGKRVIVAGLDQDFRGLPFGPMAAVLAVAEFVDKLQAICSVCARPGIAHPAAGRRAAGVGARSADQGGRHESYEARCRRCHEVRRVDNLSMWEGERG